MFELTNKAAGHLHPCRQLTGRQPTPPPQVLNAFSKIHQRSLTYLDGDLASLKIVSYYIERISCAVNYGPIPPSGWARRHPPDLFRESLSMQTFSGRHWRR